MIFGFFLLLISLLPVMSYLTRSSQENPLFQNIIPSRHLFYSVRAFAPIRQTLLLKILGDGCMGRHPISNFLGDRSPSTSARKSITINNLKNERLSCRPYMLSSLFYKLFHNLRIGLIAQIVQFSCDTDIK